MCCYSTVVSFDGERTNRLLVSTDGALRCASLIPLTKKPNDVLTNTFVLFSSRNISSIVVWGWNKIKHIYFLSKSNLRMYIICTYHQLIQLEYYYRHNATPLTGCERTVWDFTVFECRLLYLSKLKTCVTSHNNALWLKYQILCMKYKLQTQHNVLNSNIRGKIFA